MTWMSDPVSEWRTRGKEISGFTTEWMWPQKNVSFVLAINMSTQLRRHKHDQTNISFPVWILKEQGEIGKMFVQNVDQQSLDYCCLFYDANKLDTLAFAPGMFNRHLQKLPWLGLLTNLVFAQYLFRPLRFDFVLNKQWRHSDCTTYIQDLVIHMSFINLHLQSPSIFV